MLSETSGVDFIHYKHPTLLRRIERRTVLRRFETLMEYLECLRHDVAERRLLFEEVLIPVTRFFREPGWYDALKATILPRLMAGRPRGSPFRVWVPGCASGEEAYSIAICLLEYLGAARGAMSIKIIATDISERAIDIARAGTYGEGIASDVSAERLNRFFHKTVRGYEINKSIRDLCVFAPGSHPDPPFSQLDLVSCRNVLIYLGPVLQSACCPSCTSPSSPGESSCWGAPRPWAASATCSRSWTRRTRSTCGPRRRADIVSSMRPGLPPGARSSARSARSGRAP